MQEYGKTIITDVGRKMLTEVDGAKGRITYTRAALYTEDINQLSDADRVALTALTGELISTDLVVKEIKDTTVNVGASFNNAEVSKDLKFNSIGWFAKTSVDDTEKLLATTPSSTEQTLVAGNKGATTTSLDIDCLFARSHDTTVIVQTPPVGLVNGPQLIAEINKAKDEINKELPDIAQQAIDAANDDVNKLKALVNSSNIINNQKIDVDAFTQIGISKFNDCQLVSIGLTPDEDSHDGWIFNIPEKDGSPSYQQIIYINGKGVFYRTVVNPNHVVELFEKLASESDLKSLKEAIESAGQVKKVNDYEPDDKGNVILPSIEHPNRMYARNEEVDIDNLTETGIYHFMDAKVISSIKKDALDGLPKTTDGTTMCGYLFVMRHDDYNREQVLLLNGGPTDIVLATRSISGTNSWRACFRRLLNTDDFNTLWNRIITVENKELVHQCDDLDSGVSYSKAHPSVFVATP